MKLSRQKIFLSDRNYALGFAVKLQTHTYTCWSHNHFPLAEVEPYCPLEEEEVLRVLQEEGQLQPQAATVEARNDSLIPQEAARPHRVMNFVHMRTLMCQMVPATNATWELAFPFFLSRLSMWSRIVIGSSRFLLIFLAPGLLVALVLNRRDGKDIGGRERHRWSRRRLYGLAWIYGHLTHPSSNLVNRCLNGPNQTIGVRSWERFGKIKGWARCMRY